METLLDFQIPVDEEIALCLPLPENAAKMFALVDRNRSYLGQRLPWVDQNTSVNDSVNFILECRQNFKKGLGFSLFIFYRGEIAGAIGFHDIDTVNRKTEIGYWLSEELQGKGIMRRSCSALVRYAFQMLKLHRIEIRCAEDNSASQRVPEALGFRKEALLRESTLLNGKFLNTVLFGLLAPDDVKK